MKPAASNEARVRETSMRIAKDSEYYEYLFKIAESYTSSARLFTGISTLLLSLPFFNLQDYSQMVKGDPLAITLMIFAFLFLVLSIVLGAMYHFSFVQLIENEVENEGNEYERIVNSLRKRFRYMIAFFAAGAVLSGGYFIWLLAK